MEVERCRVELKIGEVVGGWFWEVSVMGGVRWGVQLDMIEGHVQLCLLRCI